MPSSLPYFAFLFVIFVGFSQPTCGQGEYGTAKFGESCEQDYHCIQNAFCLAQTTCRCEPRYLPIPDFSACIPTIGLHCSSNVNCTGMSNAECKQNVCACKEAFTVDISNSSNCLPRPVAENDRCQRNDDCTDSLQRALCINGLCQCLTSHHFTLTTGTCVKSSGMLDTCEADYQCFSPDKADPDLLECRERLCKCRPGKSSKYCNGASSNSATMLAVVFLFFTKYLT